MSEQQREIDILKAHLALCVQLFRRVAEEAGLDVDTCKLEISNGSTAASVEIGKMLTKWEEISK